MRETILNLFQSTGQLSIEAIVLRLAAASVLACFLFLSYRLSHDGSIYSKKFNVSLAALAVITTTVMIVIGNNIALSLGMVGALSIVRFRTAIKDSRDTMYIFWAIAVGICCGSGDYLVAGIGSAFVFFLLLLFGRIRNDNRMLLIIRASRASEERIESMVFQKFSRKATLRVKNTTPEHVEFIYEMSRKVLDKGNKGKTITQSLYQLDNVEYVNIVAQNDEISS